MSKLDALVTIPFSKTMSAPPASQDEEEFTRLLVQNQKRIMGLILALVPNGPDADDILQETCAVLWRRFVEFEPGTNFSTNSRYSTAPSRRPKS